MRRAGAASAITRAGLSLCVAWATAVPAAAQAPQPGPRPRPAVADTAEGMAAPLFHIEPVRPVEELRVEARRAVPPRQPAGLLAPDLVDLTTLDGRIHLDIRYATPNNFMGAPMYTSARAFLQRPAAAALLRAQRRLSRYGVALLIHDAYRPWYVTKMFWDATPDSQHTFVANPARGSRHNRGAAVDLSLYVRATGRPARMPSGYDEFSPRAASDYAGGTPLQNWYRALLRWAMEAEGFTVNPTEWWHFDYRGWARYPVINTRFEDLP